MGELGNAFRDLAAMVSSERDARRADVKKIRAHLAAIDGRLDAGDDRTSGFEAAVIDALGSLGNKIDGIETQVEKG